MPNFPALTLGDTVLGLDIHFQIPIPPAPPVPVPVPYPFTGPILLWLTPSFPIINTFINSKPAVAVGAVAYSAHVPPIVVGPPANPPNGGYWKRYLTNIAMGVVLMAMTTMANLAIAAITAFIPKPKFAEEFVKNVTGIDTTDRKTFLETAKGSFDSYTKWQTWAKLLMPPIPFPGANGSPSIGSPGVTVNGGPLGFVGPLFANSCSDIPIVPNAANLAFSNVMVGITWAGLLQAMAAGVAQAAMSHGLGKLADKGKNALAGKFKSGCPK